MAQELRPAQVNRDDLRQEIKAKYTEVALEPEKGFHFHTGRPLARSATPGTTAAPPAFRSRLPSADKVVWNRCAQSP